MSRIKCHGEIAITITNHDTGEETRRIEHNCLVHSVNNECIIGGLLYFGNGAGTPNWNDLGLFSTIGTRFVATKKQCRLAVDPELGMFSELFQTFIVSSEQLNGYTLTELGLWNGDSNSTYSMLTHSMITPITKTQAISISIDYYFRIYPKGFYDSLTPADMRTLYQLNYFQIGYTSRASAPDMYFGRKAFELPAVTSVGSQETPSASVPTTNKTGIYTFGMHSIPYAGANYATSAIYNNVFDGKTSLINVPPNASSVLIPPYLPENLSITWDDTGEDAGATYRPGRFLQEMPCHFYNGRLAGSYINTDFSSSDTPSKTLLFLNLNREKICQLLPSDVFFAYVSDDLITWNNISDGILVQAITPRYIAYAIPSFTAANGEALRKSFFYTGDTASPYTTNCDLDVPNGENPRRLRITGTSIGYYHVQNATNNISVSLLSNKVSFWDFDSTSSF